MSQQMAASMEHHKAFMGNLGDKGITITDPMDIVLQFDHEFVKVLKSRRASSSEDGLMVGNLLDHTPNYGYFSKYYFNPYTDWTNLIMMPALIWASGMATVGGPWESIAYLYNNGFDGSLNDYVLM